MFCVLKKGYFKVLTGTLFLFTSSFLLAGSASFMSEVTEEVEKLNGLREKLVSGVSGKVTGQTFKAVCKPVGKKAQQLSKKNGWNVRQASHKFRNPKNIASKEELAAIDLFEKNPNLKSFWTKEEGKDKYYRKIVVQEACLNCHGDKDQRPEFIKKKYSHDQAYGFKLGDIRGVYSVSKP